MKRLHVRQLALYSGNKSSQTKNQQIHSLLNPPQLPLQAQNQWEQEIILF
jgi:hypothetical protein